MKCQFIASVVALLSGSAVLRAEPPAASYIFPAGGQRGTTVQFRVGGLFLHQSCGFEMLGPGLKASPKLESTKTIWFEGSLLPIPDSQRQEDYPKDMAGQARIDADASLGLRYWRLWTSQGATPAMKFIVGDLPEVVEEEIDGDPVSRKVSLPVTVNGRIFPREDLDIWSFSARRGQCVLCRAEVGKLGSPLEPRLEVRDPHGRRIAESDERHGNDPVVRFTAPEDGDYQVRIHDIRFQGGQAYVYRLTITAEPHIVSYYPLGGKRGSRLKLDLAGQALPNSRFDIDVPMSSGPEFSYQPAIAGKRANPILLDVDDLPEHLEAEPNDEPAQSKPIALPGVCNGRIDKPGDVDIWLWTGRKGETLVFELRAGQLGSPLDGALTIHDEKGKPLARAESSGGQVDPLLQFAVPADGAYQVRVQDRFRSRGGPEFAYRLRVARPPAADYRLWLQTDAVTVPRKGKVALRITADRLGGFKEPIELKVDGLPAGVTAAGTKLAAGQNSVDLQIQAGAEAAIAVSRLKIDGSAKAGKDVLVRLARLQAPRGAVALDSILLAVALPTPFKIKGEYVMGFAPRGSVLKRKYSIDRNGFNGPIEIRMTDRQARHLQGAAGPVIIVPAKVSEFSYVVSLPPWMDVGRTARVCVMGIGIIKEADGSEHRVSFSSVNQNEQLVAVVGPGQLALELERTSLQAGPGKSVTLPVRIRRGQGLQGPVRIELIVPGHMRGMAATALEVPAGQERGELVLRCRQRLEGPFNMPLTVRASLVHAGHPVLAEAPLEVIPEP